MQTRALDFETERFGPANMAPKPVCLAYWMDDESGAQLVRWDEAEPILKEMLEGDIPIAVAHLAFDMKVIIEHYRALIPQVFLAYQRGILKDVLITQKLIDLAMGQHRRFGPYSLKGLVKRFYQVELDKAGSPRLDYERFRNVPLDEWPEEYIEYPKEDVRWHRSCYRTQVQDLMEDYGTLEHIEDEDRQSRGDLALSLASAWGIRTDPVAVEHLKVLTETRQAELRDLLVESGLLAWGKKKGVPVLGKKTRLAQARMLEISGGWNKIKLTKKGRELKKNKKEWREIKYVSVDAEACTDSADDLLGDYTEYAQLGTLLSGHIKAMELGVRFPIHTRFEILMDTGRTSSSNPNIQNVRRKEGARECFVPRPGCAFVGCDYDKAELHTLAQVCINLFKRSKLAEVLNSGIDPHTALGAELMGVSYEKGLSLLGAEDPDMAAWRQRAKIPNFGFPGGMGPWGMVAFAKSNYGVRMTFQEAEDLYNGWQNQWPVVQEYLAWVGMQCRAGGGVMDVKHFLSNRYRQGVSFCVAANSHFQGMAADGAKAALFEVARRQYSVPSSALYGTRTVNFVHDELILEAKLEQANDAAWELRDVMVEKFNMFTPDVPVRATPCVMDRWSKKAKTLIDDEGRLQLWRYAA